MINNYFGKLPGFGSCYKQCVGFRAQLLQGVCDVWVQIVFIQPFNAESLPEIGDGPLDSFHVISFKEACKTVPQRRTNALGKQVCRRDCGMHFIQRVFYAALDADFGIGKSAIQIK